MNILEKHNIDIPVSEISLFESQVGITSAFHIMKGIQLKDKTIEAPTLLICIEGKLIFQDEKGKNEILVSGDFVNIEPLIKYSLRGLTNSQILLIK